MLCFPKMLLAAVLTLLLLMSAPVRAEDWPQWRGLNRDGVWNETDLLHELCTPLP
jgi:outer membrane protein assembly factor BamB